MKLTEIPTEIRRWLVVGCVIAALCLIMAVFTTCRNRDNERARSQTEAATGKALDRVTTQTGIIRDEQEDKQNEVDTIPGSSDRLPDGYGAELERVRRGERRNP